MTQTKTIPEHHFKCDGCGGVFHDNDCALAYLNIVAGSVNGGFCAPCAKEHRVKKAVRDFKRNPEKTRAELQKKRDWLDKFKTRALAHCVKSAKEYIAVLEEAQARVGVSL